MVAKSIVDIDVNDDKFVAFMERFREYQSALEDLPEAWRVAAVGIGESSKETEKAKGEAKGLGAEFNAVAEAILTINSGLDRLNNNLDDSTKKQDEFNKNTRSANGLLSDATKDAKSLASHIKEATASLLSWGGIVGLFTGVLGVGGLFGINRLAAGAAQQRFTSLGLGTTAGGLSASEVDYRRAIGNPVGTLGAIRDAQMDLSRRWTFSAMGINNPDQDPAKLLPQMIRNARDIFVQNGSTLQGAQAHGLTNFFTLDDLNRFKNMSDAEIESMQKRAERDAERLNITDEQNRKWTDFTNQLDLSERSINRAFVIGLGPLTPQLSKLSDALSGAIDTALKSPELGKWIDGLAGGIEKFGNYLASPDFTNDVNQFMTNIREMCVTVDNVIKFLKGETFNDWMKKSEDSANSAAEWVKDKTRFDPRSVGPAMKEFLAPSWGKIKSAFIYGDLNPVFSEPADISDKSRTIADRFNNPGNLRSAYGYDTHNTKSGKFAVFPTLDEGVLAATKQLQIYGARGINTIDEISRRWAPSKENNTQEYIRHVVRTSGFNEHQQLNLNDPKVLAKLISAMASKEGAGNRVTESAVIQIYNNTGGNAIVAAAQLGAQ
ncbi:hypothetical protein FML24_04155 [Klebsiella oxytoca]|uniref:hypothetical protein n=1 Tax=Klebsiella oxytoca TaxID=571 RepID=UPI0013D3C8E8|nr:hypothetical protein [Klebsiella oxytoca]EKW2357283.1 hypothetical protein [Klebsiella oxytoca]EKW2423212.1 hypothetical protein [Klebsiella oxytoca]ELK0740046.1 hypothetical protein [Klebsiella oxytoca]MBZ7692507.1 hypothetical protein [Klebsiella oxytoca]MDS7885132.1 hypothetical protein [Klebsiella oxytoca]